MENKDERERLKEYIIENGFEDGPEWFIQDLTGEPLRLIRSVCQEARQIKAAARSVPDSTETEQHPAKAKNKTPKPWRIL